MPVRLALEQTDGSVFRFDTRLLPASHPQAAGNAALLERFVKFLLWSRGGWRLHIDGPADEVARLAAHYRDTADRSVRLEFRRRARLRPPVHDRSHVASCRRNAR